MLQWFLCEQCSLDSGGLTSMDTLQQFESQIQLMFPSLVFELRICVLFSYKAIIQKEANSAKI